MTDKVQKIREKVARIQLYSQSEVLKDILDYIDKVQEEPVSEELEEASLRASILRGQYIPKEYLDEYPYDAYAQRMFKRGAKWQKAKDSIVSEQLEKVAELYTLDDSIKPWKNLTKEAFKAGTNWQKTHLWKPADGYDLPEIDREVIVLVKYNTQRNIHNEEYSTYRVEFAHRPDSKGWNGKSISTGKVEHYTPKTYGKGGWNIPDIVYWLDVELPKEIEL